jgi:hypothetical protein
VGGEGHPGLSLCGFLFIFLEGGPSPTHATHHTDHRPPPETPPRPPPTPSAHKRADYLTETLDRGGLPGMLALHGIFLLVTRHGLEYPRFYARLYQLITPDAFHVRSIPACAPPPPCRCCGGLEGARGWWWWWLVGGVGGEGGQLRAGEGKGGVEGASGERVGMRRCVAVLVVVERGSIGAAGLSPW